MRLLSQTWESRRQDERTANNADQAEFAAVQRGSCNLEAGTFDERVAGVLDDYEVEDPLIQSPRGQWNWARDDMALDNAASDIGVEVRRRQQVLGALYPFGTKGNRLVYKPSWTLVYEFCLAVSQAPSLSEGPLARLPVAFERLARDVLVIFLGPGAQGIRTGWPADEHEPRPPRFKEVISGLNKMTGEWIWSPDLGMPDDPDHKIVKDEGLDVVVWKEVHDDRPGRVFLLGQCACGNDYATKFDDIDEGLKRLSKWIRPLSCVTPVRVFTTPRHIPNDLDFADVNKRAGFALDRTRITLLAESEAGREYVPKQAKVPYADLIASVINGFQAAPQGRGRRPRRAGAARRSRSRGTGA